ncbi:MAG: TolC family protein [Desulfohalobiaceae bacterium]|nr:TolC family protein [Desulfohalobiaceae bacterium]
MKNIAIWLAVLVFIGCAPMSPTDPYKPVVRSGGFASVPRPAIQPAVAPEGPLTLQQAIEIGLANNPGVAALDWETAGAEARHDQAFSERLPRLDAVSGYTHSLDAQRLSPVSEGGDTGLFSRNILAGDLVLSMPLFTGGRLVNRVKAADLLRQALSQRLARSREELVFNVSSVFYRILAQRHVIESLEFSRQTLAEHMKRIEAMIKAKKAARVDRMRTDVRLADVQQQLAREKNLLVVLRRTLANFLGQEENMDKIRLQGKLALGEEAGLPELETALAEAWNARDDYLAVKSALEAQARNVDAARAGNWPDVSFQGSYGGNLAAGQTSGTGDDLEDEGRIGLAMEMPLFDGGRIRAEVREQYTRLAAAQKRLRELELEIRLEIETALAGIESSQQRARALQKSIIQAKESLRIEQQKYNLGKGAIVDVLDAQASLLETETTYYQMLAELQTAMAQLKLATGKR